MAPKEVKVAIIGYGNIGREVLQNTPFLKGQTLAYLNNFYSKDLKEDSVYFRLIGLADSSTYLYGNIDLPRPPSDDLIAQALAQSRDFRDRIERYKEDYGFVRCLAAWLEKHGKDVGVKGDTARGMGGSELLNRLREEHLAPDIVVDVTPTKNPEEEGPDKVLDRIKIAMRMGSNVVLANKAPIAYHFKETKELSEKNRRAIRCEATVGGEIPFLNEIANYKGSGVLLRGIINGTTNYILNRLAQGIPYEAAFKHAAKLKLTESDPGEDTLGIDAARKLIIISKLAGKELREGSILVSGITKMKVGGKFIELRPTTLKALEEFKKMHPAGPEHYQEFDSLSNGYIQLRRSLGYVPKLVAELDLGTGQGRVYLEWVCGKDPLAAVDEAKNRIILYKDGKEVYQSPPLRGAGPEATANAIMLDCTKIAYNLEHPLSVTMF